jgi:hypothetical protein
MQSILLGSRVRRAPGDAHLLHSESSLYALDWWSGQETADVWIDKLLDLQAKWKPMRIWGESGVIRSGFMFLYTLNFNIYR